MTKRNPITRRSFLALAAVAAVGALAAGTGVVRFFRLGNDCSPFIAAVIRYRLDYLRIPAEDLQRFADDFQARRIHAERRRFWVLLAGFSFIHRIVDLLVQLTPRAAAYNELCKAIEETFLLSSDFFFHAADEGRTVHYIGYYDPYERPCSNPFARFDFE